MNKISKRFKITNSNLENIPTQSGAYILFRAKGKPYIGSAGARRLQARVKTQLKSKRGVTSFKYRTTTSEREARKLEALYRDKFNPGQRI